MKKIILILIVTLLVNNLSVIYAEDLNEDKNYSQGITTYEWDSLLPNTEGRYHLYNFFN